MRARALASLFAIFGWAAALSPGPVEAVVDTSGLSELSAARVSVSLAGGRFNRRTRHQDARVTLTNVSGNEIRGTVYLVVDSVSPAVSSIVNPEDTTQNGDPLYIALSDGVLAPGASVLVSPVSFSSRLRVTVTTRVFLEPPATSDTTPPDVSIATPIDGRITNESPVTVTGTVTPDTVSVSVDGQAATLTGGAFSLAGVVLAEGPNTIQVRATDGAGNTGQASVTVVLDTTPPALAFSTPSDGALVASASVAVNGTVQDANPVAVTVNGAAVTVTGGSFDAGTVGLAEGANTLTAVATDAAGNQSVAAIQVARDSSAPQVAITSPADGATVPSSPIDVGGTVSDPNLSEVRVNGLLAVVTNGRFVATGVVLSPGANPISALATDRAGNSGLATISVTLPVPPPAVQLSVQITDPAGRSLLNSLDPVPVSGTVDDPAATVLVNGIAATVTPGSGPGASASWVASQPVPVVEGTNIISATATKGASVGNDSIQVIVDTTPPVVTVETPRNGARLTSLQVDVAGLVNDITTGTTINSDDCRVTVNGVQAQVSNRSFLVPNFLLQRGRNELEVEVEDRAGNTARTRLEVTVQDQVGQRIVPLSGNGQMAPIASPLPRPLVVSLLDDNGDPVAGQPVTFEVSRGDGFVSADPQQDTRIVVNTDDNGVASVSFILGFRAGAGIHRVSASAPGYAGEVEFCATAEVGPPALVTAVSGDMQTGVAEKPLPAPFTALVTDRGGNPVSGVDVAFDVEEGGGELESASALVRATDTDGLVSAVLTLGPQEGINNNVVAATIPVSGTGGTVFNASARVPGNVSDTRVSGVVLDNQDNPVPHVKMSVFLAGQPVSTALKTFTDDQGMFSVTGAPVGDVRVIADGSTTTRTGTWPTLEFALKTIAGQNNQLQAPIWILPLADNTVLVQNGGPDTELLLSMSDVPGTELRIAPHSVTCPPGQSECFVSWTQIRSGRVPMVPPNGSNFLLAWTTQPAGTHFDPPLGICIPNVDAPPGTQVEMFSFDHDLGEFVAIGTATVTGDGAQLCSDPGFGIVKSGWGGCAPPPPPRRCTISCNDRNECTRNSKQDPPCRCNTERLSGNTCGDRPGANSCKKPGICSNGICVAESKPDGGSCDDGRACTKDDKCAGGQCKGTELPPRNERETTITLEPLNRALQKAQKYLGLMQIKGVKIPKVEGSIKFNSKEVCCEEQNGVFTLEESGGGALGIPLFKTPVFRPQFPPWATDAEVTVFGRRIGVAYGVEVFGQVSLSADLNRTKRECQNDICWSGGVKLGADVTAGLFGEVPNPALPPECGPQENMPCSALSVKGNATSGLNAQLGVSCDKVSGQVGHNGLKFNAEFKALEGTFLSFSITRTITIINPGSLGGLEFNLPL